MKNKGVTLIALIITIIVLLVLAGVSLSALVGDNGILTRAASVEEEYSKSELEEQLTMIINEQLVDAYETISEDESDYDISVLFNEENLITYLSDNDYIEVAYGANEIIPVRTPDDDNFVLYDAYYIKASNVSSNIDAVGIGSNDGTLINVFLLEVTDTTTDESGNTVSIGKYNINYYDSDNNCEKLTEVLLYTTYNS